MRNFIQVRGTLTTFFKNSKEVSNGVGKVAPYVALLTTGVATGGTTLTVAGLVGAAAAAVEGISAILAVVADPEARKAKLDNEERFETCFHLLCHQSHCHAVEATLKRRPELQGLAVTLEPLDKAQQQALEEVFTAWDFDLDFSAAAVPLFDAYNERFQTLLSRAGVKSDEAQQVVSEINDAARHTLLKLMSKPAKPYDWVYRYAQIAELTKVGKAAGSIPAAIEKAIQKATDNFIDRARTAGPKEAWKDYRDYLVDLTKREIFGSDFGIEDLYVMPAFSYYRAGRRSPTRRAAEETLQLTPRLNLPLFLGQLISNRTSRDNLIFIFGDPGIGKTSFSKMFAAGLARSASFHPIFIPLQNIDPTADLLKEVETFLEGTQLRDAVRSLPSCSNVVFILDAFDELAQATRERMGDFFRRLERFSHDQVYRNAAVIATGRHTLFSENDVLIPANTHVVTLQPFDKPQIAEWSGRWNQLTGQSFDGTAFWKDEKEHRGDLHEIATQPLLLYLLAKLEEEGQRIDPRSEATSRSEIYRHIVQWCCDRHEELRQSQALSGVTLTRAQMRRFLRVAGFATLALGSRNVHIEQLQGMLERAGLAAEAVQRRENYEAQQTFLSMAFREVGQSSWEFKHKSFGEYLAAEHIGEAVGRTINEKEDPDVPGQCQWEMKDDEVAALWADLFARNSLTPEVQGYLERMLGSWTQFVRGEPAADPSAGLRKLLERCGMMYARFVRERDMEQLTAIARDARIEPTRALANLGSATLMLGTYCARALSTEQQPVYFELEQLVPDGWWKMLHSLIQHLDFSNYVLLRRMFHGASLNSDEGLSFPSSNCPGLLLPYVRLNKVRQLKSKYKDFPILLDLTGSRFYRGDLSYTDLSNVVLTATDFYYANLQGAVLRTAPQASFHRTNLAEADMRECYLQLANFFGANLIRANLQAASLTEVRFWQTNLSEANLEHANLREASLFYANLRMAVLRSADLRRADLRRADLSGADLRGAMLSGAHLEDIDLTGALLEGAIFDLEEMKKAKNFDKAILGKSSEGK